MQNSKRTIIPKELGKASLFSFLRKGPNLTLVFPKDPMKLIALILELLVIVFLCSCNTTKNSTAYFQNLQKDTLLRNVIAPDYHLKIQKNDILGITVNSLSPDIAFYNNQSSAGSSGATTGKSSGVTSAGAYPVSPEGNIEFPKLGSIHVEGMTRQELQDSLQNALIPYLRESIVSVNFTNRHITMLGGVSTSVLPLSDNMTILDALALSGDIGDKGRPDNVLVIRDTAGAKITKRLSLKNSSVFSSPYFYMQPNDIVYIEPEKAKQQLTAQQVVSLVAGSISLIVVLKSLFKL